MEFTRTILDVVAASFLVLTFLALLLKRDKQDKYLLPSLLTPPLAVIYLMVAQNMGDEQLRQLSPFELQALGYQAAAVVLALLSRMESQIGQMGFWLAVLMNFGTVGVILYYAHFHFA